MSTSSLCPRCGERVAADSPRGLCPRCLLGEARGMLERGQPTASAGRRFVPPRPADLARHFPQLEILELLGQGGMGAVYKARQPGLDRVVALKILPPALGEDPSFAERFGREARLLARLNHPHIVAVHDSGRAGDYFFLLMEYVDGVNLREVMQAGTLGPQQALAIVPQICDALQYAHEEGVVHRDIKPENVLLDRRGRVKVADFGLAKMIAGPLDEEPLTGTHQVMGTLRYMAPEQLEGTRAVDHRADIYSLGVVLYELLTGELPLGRFAPPSQRAAVDARLDHVVLRTLEKEPERRYQRASEVKTDLDTISHPQPHREQHLPLRYWGYEYRSPVSIGSWPLIHIAYGFDPATGRLRTAKGIVAIGARALGVFALGGVACGVFTLAGVGVGLFTLGGVALGLLLALGGVAISLGAALGGAALGALAVGGAAVGYLGLGGAVLAVHGYGATGQDPTVFAILRSGAWPLLQFGLAALLLTPLAAALALASIFWANRYAEGHIRFGGRDPQPPPVVSKVPASPSLASRMLAALLLAATAVALLLISFYFLLGRGEVRQAIVIETPNSVVTPEKRSYESWTMTDQGIRVGDFLIERLALTAEQVEQVNPVLAEMHEAYAEIERSHWQQSADAAGRVTTFVPELDEFVAPLESQLWSKLDPLLTPDQQRQARQHLQVYAPDTAVGMSVDELVRPGLLGWGGAATVTVWPVGQWVKLTVQRQSIPVYSQTAVELPLLYRRFGATPPPQDPSRATESSVEDGSDDATRTDPPE